jgi:outer membrane protein OmpA-like peptidoglycan-associated protein
MIRTSTVCAIERILLAALLLVAATEAIAQADAAGSRDHPLFNRMAGYWIEEFRQADFDTRAFRVPAKEDPYGEQAVEGRVTEITYRPREGAKPPSGIQITRNYVNAVAQSGGRVVYQGPERAGDDRYVSLVLSKGGREIWVEVQAGAGGEWYTLAVVEKGAMAQEITANDIYDALAKQGRIALYILFDTGKATIKPGSQAIVKQVVDMMKAHPDLKVAVEGHTDNAGVPAANRTLSDSRAKAVMAAIAAQGIAPARLTAAGYGQDRPVADNATEDGRAKNRRVELVRR